MFTGTHRNEERQLSADSRVHVLGGGLGPDLGIASRFQAPQTAVHGERGGFDEVVWKHSQVFRSNDVFVAEVNGSHLRKYTHLRSSPL